MTSTPPPTQQHHQRNVFSLDTPLAELEQEHERLQLRQVATELAALFLKLTPKQQRELGILCSMVGLAALMTSVGQPLSPPPPSPPPPLSIE